MTTRHGTGRPAAAAFVAMLACGCHSYTTQRYLVVDADTGRPIPGAKMRVTPGAVFGMRPVGLRGTSATGGDDGVVRIRVPERWGFLAMQVLANGYETTFRAPANVEAPPGVEVWAMDKWKPPASNQTLKPGAQ